MEGIAGSVDVVRRVGEKAAASGITLGMEVVNRYESNVLNTAAQALEFVKRVSLPNVKVHLDCYHMNIEEADVAEAIQHTGEHLGYFHTGDSHRGYLGSGSIDFSKIFRARRHQLSRSNHFRIVLFKGNRPAPGRRSRDLAQPLGGQPGPGGSCKGVY
jgi:sugar phosphate isomerase/epimerase